MFFLDSVRGVQPVPTDTSVHHRRRPLLGRDDRLLKQTHPGRSSKVSPKNQILVRIEQTCIRSIFQTCYF